MWLPCRRGRVKRSNRFIDKVIIHLLLADLQIKNGIVDEGRLGPIPPPFPNGKGAGRFMGLLIFQSNVLLEEQIASPPWGRRERGLYLDLTQMSVINRRVGLPSPVGEGIVLTSSL